ncbi:head GIN domain-containing protein [Patulibacter americanus]|uniref:head GIN domain-containing protein n=1 Tax=Patulibacter americanus TaxID=588672 RepID=UPI0003B76678|nr:head GIN domain-containing protein [Patulibacter americanus]
MTRPRTPRAAFLGPVLVLAAAAVIGCGADGGPAASTIRTLTAVDAIDAEGGLRVVVVRGERASVRIEGPESEVEDVTVDVEDGTLRLDGDDDGLFGIGTGQRATATVTLPRLRAVDVGGAVDLRVDDLGGEALELRAAGGSDVAGSGRVGELTATSSGGADVDLGELVARDVTLAVSGGADVAVHASRKLDVDVSGGGDVTYAGDPKVTQRLSAGADLRRK